MPNTNCLMKYYIGELDIRCGVYEYRATIKFQIEDKLSTPEKELDRIAASYYGEPEDRHVDKECHDGGYYFNGGEVFVETGNWQECDKQTFDALTIITDLTIIMEL